MNYHYFQFCGVVQMMINDKKTFSYVLAINNRWIYSLLKSICILATSPKTYYRFLTIYEKGLIKHL